MENMMIGSTELDIKEWNGVRVVTLADIDRVHGRPTGTARKAFNRHKNRLTLGKDYFVLDMDESKSAFGIHAPKGLTTITESGYFMIAKVFDDDLAWEVQCALVERYFQPVASNIVETTDTQTLAAEIRELKAQVAHLTDLVEHSSAVKAAEAFEKVALYEWRERVLGLVRQIGSITKKDDKAVLSRAYKIISSQFEPRINQFHKDYQAQLGHSVSMLDSIYWMETEHKVESELLLGMLRIMLCRAAEGNV